MDSTKIVGGGVTLAGGELVIEPRFGAARVTQRPLDYTILGKILGHYKVGPLSGNLATPGANAIIASLRWPDPSNVFILMRLGVGLVVQSAVTAQAITVAATI